LIVVSAADITTTAVAGAVAVAAVVVLSLLPPPLPLPLPPFHLLPLLVDCCLCNTLSDLGVGE
jgi:hypothetical protein